MADIDDTPGPIGELTLQTIAMPKDTNPQGDIFGGWLLSQMDLAGGITAGNKARGRVATVSVDQMSFMVPVKVGDVVSVYTEIVNVGRSSITIAIEVWSSNHETLELQKVTDGVFVFVAIDDKGRTRSVPNA